MTGDKYIEDSNAHPFLVSEERLGHFFSARYVNVLRWAESWVKQSRPHLPGVFFKFAALRGITCALPECPSSFVGYRFC
jgi:hypothetical protein